MASEAINLVAIIYPKPEKAAEVSKSIYVPFSICNTINDNI